MHAAIHASPANRGRLVEACLGFLRLLLVAVVIVAAVILGFAVPYLLRSYIAGMHPGGLVFGAATVLAVAKDLIQTLPTAVEYVRTAAPNSLTKLFAEITIAALGLCVAWYTAMAPEPAPSPQPALNLSVSASLPPIILNQGGSLFASYLIFQEEQSVLVDESQQLDQLGALVSTLAGCIQSPSDEVDLLIRAYASSSGSDAKNTQLYKERSAYTAMVLGQAIAQSEPMKKEQFNIEVREWQSLDVMKVNRLFRDTDARGKYLEEAGGLNRRSEILVRSAGACFSG